MNYIIDFQDDGTTLLHLTDAGRYKETFTHIIRSQDLRIIEHAIYFWKHMSKYYTCNASASLKELKETV